MENIIIVETFSTGCNFIADICARGYHAVSLEMKCSDIDEIRTKGYSQIEYDFELIKEQDTYEETLELVRSYNPICILPGSELGVGMATRLADSLGLWGNPASIINAMTTKNGMHEALESAGVRSIQGKIVYSEEEARNFCRENNLTRAVVKPLQSAGSVGVTMCDTVDEAMAAVKNLFSAQDFYGREQTCCLIQERIDGIEYIVNTITCGGKTRLTSIWRYKKVKTTEGGQIYDYCELIKELEPGHAEIIEYAFDTVRAIGIQNGMVHGEYMLDKKGPVLIEVNCRPMGANLPADYLDALLGQHETDAILDTALHPECFEIEAQKAYNPVRKGCFKFIMVPYDTETMSLPLWVIASRLRSTYKIDAADRYSVRSYPKTRDLELSGGTVYMLNDDENVLEADLQLLREIEADYFGYILNDGMTKPWFIKAQDVGRSQLEDLRQIIDSIEPTGGCLIVTDKKTQIPGNMVVTPDELDSVHGMFENVVIRLQDSLVERNEADALELLFDIMDMARPSGRVYIPESTYRYISYGRRGTEILLRVLGYSIMAPRPEDHRCVIGLRKM